MRVRKPKKAEICYDKVKEGTIESEHTKDINKQEINITGSQNKFRWILKKIHKR